MFNKKQKLINNLRLELMIANESLESTRNCFYKQVAECGRKEKHVEYLQRELLRARRDIDALRKNTPPSTHRTVFKKPSWAGLKQLTSFRLKR